MPPDPTAAGAPFLPPRATALAQQLLVPAIAAGDTVVDATAGNGHDTLFLARQVGPGGTVLAFDIQASAIEASRRRIEQAGVAAQVRFYQESHTRLAARIPPASASAVMFNLGYLPGDGHAVITEAAETLLALEAAAQVLKPGGCLSVVCYPGHAGGETEAAQVLHWMESLPARNWRVARYSHLGTARPAPFLLLAGKS